MWVVFDGGRKGGVAGGLGEIGRPILKDSRGVLGLGLLRKEEVEVLRFWWISEGERGLSLAGDYSGMLGSLSRMNSLFFLLSSPPVSGSDFSSFPSEFCRLPSLALQVCRPLNAAATTGARTTLRRTPVRLEQEVAGRAELQASGYCSSATREREEGEGAVAVGWAGV